MTLADLIAAKPVNSEAVDWAFHDLTVPIGEEMELMVLGNLPERLDAEDWKRLKYGFPRFIKNYRAVIVDGRHDTLYHLIPDDALRPVWVICPQAPTPLEDELPFKSHTPYVIFNQSDASPIPPDWEARFREGELRLIGKLPHYPTSEDRIRKLGDDFHNCLLRMNIPVELAIQTDD